MAISLRQQGNSLTHAAKRIIQGYFATSSCLSLCKSGKFNRSPPRPTTDLHAPAFSTLASRRSRSGGVLERLCLVRHPRPFPDVERRHPRAARGVPGGATLLESHRFSSFA